MPVLSWNTILKFFIAIFSFVEVFSLVTMQQLFRTMMFSARSVLGTAEMTLNGLTFLEMWSILVTNETIGDEKFQFKNSSYHSPQKLPGHGPTPWEKTPVFWSPMNQLEVSPQKRTGASSLPPPDVNVH